MKRPRPSTAVAAAVFGVTLTTIGAGARRPVVDASLAIGAGARRETADASLALAALAGDKGTVSFPSKSMAAHLSDRIGKTGDEGGGARSDRRKGVFASHGDTVGASGKISDERASVNVQGTQGTGLRGPSPSYASTENQPAKMTQNNKDGSSKDQKPDVHRDRVEDGSAESSPASNSRKEKTKEESPSGDAKSNSETFEGTGAIEAVSKASLEPDKDKPDSSVSKAQVATKIMEGSAESETPEKIIDVSKLVTKEKIGPTLVKKTKEAQKVKEAVEQVHSKGGKSDAGLSKQRGDQQETEDVAGVIQVIGDKVKEATEQLEKDKGPDSKPSVVEKLKDLSQAIDELKDDQGSHSDKDQTTLGNGNDALSDRDKIEEGAEKQKDVEDVKSSPKASSISGDVSSHIGAKDIGSGIVVVTNKTAGKQILAIDTSDANLDSVKPFQPPQGWDSIADVALFGCMFFFPTVIFVSFRFLHDSVIRSSDSSIKSVNGVCSLLYGILCSGFQNTARLRHCRGEDIGNLGSEGALYLALQRETTVMMLVLTVFGCSTLLPLHLAAHETSVDLEFTRSTIQNLGKHSPLLWVHTLFFFLFSCVYYRFMSNCRGHVEWAWKHGVVAARSLDMWDASVFVKNSLPALVTEKTVRDLLEEIYPGKVVNVFMIMDTSESDALERKKQQIEADIEMLRRFARQSSLSRNDNVGGGPALSSDVESPGEESVGASNDSPFKQAVLDSRDFTLLGQRQRELRAVKAQESELEGKHAGKCIVTFSSVGLARHFSSKYERKQAVRAVIEDKLTFETVTTLQRQRTRNACNAEEQAFLDDYNAAERAAASVVLQASVDETRICDWDVVPSPDPHDLIWEALHLDPAIYWMRTIFSNLLIMALVLLITMPTTIIGLVSHVGSSSEAADPGKDSKADVALTLLDADSLEKYWVTKMTAMRLSHPALASFLFVFAPLLIIVLVNNALYTILYVAAKYWEPHHSYSAQEVAILVKTFWFTLFTTLLVPALAFKTLNGVVGEMISADASPFSLLGQVFVVTSGAFTLTFVITQALVGSAFELVNLPNMVWRFTMKTCWRWASSEQRRDAEESKLVFDFGSQYAVFLAVLCLVFMFSASVPVILPVGLGYFFIKICVDQYQLNFLCGRAQSHSVPRCRIGRAAVRYLPIPLLLFQVSMIGFFSSYVCLPNEIVALASGRNPRGCTVASPDEVDTVLPGTQVVRATVGQLVLMMALFVYTASDCLYVALLDSFNEDAGMITGAGFAEKPFASDQEKRHEHAMRQASSRDLSAQSRAGGGVMSGFFQTVWESFNFSISFNKETRDPQSPNLAHENEANGSFTFTDEPIEAEEFDASSVSEATNVNKGAFPAVDAYLSRLGPDEELETAGLLKED